jgi:hypothetical protein
MLALADDEVFNGCPQQALCVEAMRLRVSQVDYTGTTVVIAIKYIYFAML